MTIIPAAISGSVLWPSSIELMKRLREAEFSNVDDARIFNEQVKMLASSLNFVALGLFAAALLKPVSEGSLHFGAYNVVVCIGAIYLHSLAQRILETLKNGGK
jgi:hypothetical protein